MDLPIKPDDDIDSASIQESIETVEKITDLFENRDVPLERAQTLHEHAQRLIDHLKEELNVDDIDTENAADVDAQ